MSAACQRAGCGHRVDQHYAGDEAVCGVRGCACAAYVGAAVDNGNIFVFCARVADNGPVAYSCVRGAGHSPPCAWSLPPLPKSPVVLGLLPTLAVAGPPTSSTSHPDAPQRRSSDAVDHPAHYGGADNPYEAIKVIEAWGLGFNLGNAVKYICRAGRKHKAGVPVDDAQAKREDLKKAAWYLQREIANLSRS